MRINQYNLTVTLCAFCFQLILLFISVVRFVHFSQNPLEGVVELPNTGSFHQDGEPRSTGTAPRSPTISEFTSIRLGERGFTG